MCMTPEAEMQLAAAMDETGEWLEQHAPAMRRQADVIQLHRRNELEQHVPHPEIDDELRDGSWSDEIKQVAILVGVLVVLLLVTKIPFIDWRHVAELIGWAR